MDIELRLFDMAVVLSGALGGWVLNSIKTSVRDLQESDKALADKVSRIEVLVAGDYIRKDEFRDAIASVNESLRRIEDKLNTKADKDD